MCVCACVCVCVCVCERHRQIMIYECIIRQFGIIVLCAISFIIQKRNKKNLGVVLDSKFTPCMAEYTLPAIPEPRTCLLIEYSYTFLTSSSP